MPIGENTFLVPCPLLNTKASGCAAGQEKRATKKRAGSDGVTKWQASKEKGTRSAAASSAADVVVLDSSGDDDSED